MNRKTKQLLKLFVLTLAGVVSGGILLFLIYSFTVGRIAAKEADQALADAADNIVLSQSDEQIYDNYSGKEAISADDPALKAKQEALEEQETTGSEADADTSYKARYSGVYERFGDDLDDAEYLASNKIYILDSRDNDSEKVTMTFGGDILFDDEYAVTARLMQNGGHISAGIDQALIDMMHASDITMVNNEFPYSYGGTPTEGKTYTFRADPPMVKCLDDMGVNAVGIANNHAFDFGEQAFLDTLTTLEEDEMPYCGGGRNINEASAPLYFVIDDIKIGIIAATQIERLDNPDTRGATDTLSGVFRCLNPDRLLSVVSETRKHCDFLVVFIHWGTESTTEIDWIQQDQAPKIADAGADLIIGAHPHVLQPIGTSNGIPVIYSLGNFWFNSKELDTCLVQATVSRSDTGTASHAGALSSLRFIPCRQVGCKTYPASGEEYNRIISDMNAMSPQVTIDDNGYIAY